MDAAREILVGEVRGVYGVRGWVKLFSFTDPRDNLLRFETFATDTGTSLTLVEGRAQGKGLIGRFEGIADRDAALALNGVRLSVSRDVLPTLQAQEYYWSDLIGSSVVDKHRGVLGVVDHLIETGAHDVLVLKGVDGEQELIPFVVDVTVKSVDAQAGRIVVDWPGADGRAG